MASYSKRELTVLRRLAMDPSQNQVELAQNFGVTRSAVNHIWGLLKRKHGLRIASLIDYGRIGYEFIFGWAVDSSNQSVVREFSKWLDGNPYVIYRASSALGITQESLNYFEALLPCDKSSNWFKSQLARFERRPYNLRVAEDSVKALGHHLNLGLFDGQKWSFSDAFRFEASMDTAKDFIHILPSPHLLYQSPCTSADIGICAAASQLERNYYSTDRDVSEFLSKMSLPIPSGRTIRRKLSSLRFSITMPYIMTNDLVPDGHVIICVKDTSLSRKVISLLGTQSTQLPYAQVVIGNELMSINLRFPSSSMDWIQLSHSLIDIVKDDAQIYTFIPDNHGMRKGLEHVLKYIITSRSEKID